MERTPGEEQHARWRLVVAVDGSEGSREALLCTARLARVMKAEVVAIHTVGDWDEQWQEWVDRVRGRLIDTWCRPLRDAGIDYRPIVLEGGADDLLSYVRKVGGDFLVVGRRGLGGFRELLLGSFSQRLIHHSPIPVLVVPDTEIHAIKRGETPSAMESTV